MVVGAMDVDMQKVMRRVPKSNRQKMYDYFVEHITAGDLPAGTILDNTANLAERFEVAIMTAQRTLQDLARDGYIIREPGKRTRIAKLPNAPLKIARNGCNIGVMLPRMGGKLNSLESPFHFHYVQGIVAGAQNLRKNVTILSVAGEQMTPEALSKLDLCGIICVSPTPKELEYLSTVKATGIPLVLITPRPGDLFNGYCGVERDYYTTGQKSLEYFCNRKYKKIIFVTATTFYYGSHQQMLMHGFAQAAAEHNIKFSVLEMFCSKVTHEEVDAAADMLKERLADYDAIFCPEEIVCQKVHQLFPEKDKIGLHWNSTAVQPPYTYFQVSNEELGCWASELVGDFINQKYVDLKLNYQPLTLIEHEVMHE